MKLFYFILSFSLITISSSAQNCDSIPNLLKRSAFYKAFSSYKNCYDSTGLKHGLWIDYKQIGLVTQGCGWILIDAKKSKKRNISVSYKFDENCRVIGINELTDTLISLELDSMEIANFEINAIKPLNYSYGKYNHGKRIGIWFWPEEQLSKEYSYVGDSVFITTQSFLALEKETIVEGKFYQKVIYNSSSDSNNYVFRCLENNCELLYNTLLLDKFKHSELQLVMSKLSSGLYDRKIFMNTR